MTWIDVVPHMKAAHLSFLALWTAGLYALPKMLSRHDRDLLQSEFVQIRRATHYSYVWLVTPAAVLAIASGCALIFIRDVFTVWLFAKLVLVAGLVAVHAWIGHTIINVAETEGRHEPPNALIPAVILTGLILGILLLVLAKPELEELPVPAWLQSPLDRPLPFDVPNR